METFALATTAPDESVTVPATVAPATCAWTGADTRAAKVNNTHTNKPRKQIINFLLGVWPISHIANGGLVTTCLAVTLKSLRPCVQLNLRMPWRQIVCGVRKEWPR